MYAKCGSLRKAKEVFEVLPVRNVVSWNALIAGYVQRQHCMEALSCFEWMQQEGISPDVVTFVCILKACGSIGARGIGEDLHSKIITQELLDRNVILGNSLVDMYAKCGALSKAKEVLEGLPSRDVVSWNGLIAGYVQGEHMEEALKCFEQMQTDGLSPNAVTFICILKACGSIGALSKGEHIHSEVLRLGLLGENAVLGGALVDMYAKCGALEKAKQVLEDLPVKDVFSWSSLIGGYVQKGNGKEALDFFEQMHHQNLCPDAVTFICALKACGSIGALDKGTDIHCEIARQGLLIGHIELGNALVDLYVKCGALFKAKEVLEGLPARDVVTWNALIVGYAQGEHATQVLDCFEMMQCDNLSPDAVTYACVLKACVITGALELGADIHVNIVRFGLLDRHSELGNALVDMYAKCGDLVKAKEVLEDLPVRDVITWSALISGYVLEEHGKNALICFDQMQREGLSPNIVTFIVCLKACGSIGALDRGKYIHSEIGRMGLLGRDVVLGNALLDMYVKCGVLGKAKEVLEGLPVRDVVSWSAVIAGYAQGEHGKEALGCFEQMQCEGFTPNAVTYICILKACGSIGALDRGEKIHSEIIRQGSLLDRYVSLGNSLVDMYARCGAHAKAKDVLDGLFVRDLVTWNALIAGYSQGQYANEALMCFEQMQLEGLSPNGITFICVLNACSHSGLLDDAQRYFIKMSSVFDIRPSSEHHTCMINLFGHVGLLDNAVAVVDQMSLSGDFPLWVSLLSVCKKWGNMKLSSWAFQEAIKSYEGTSVHTSTISHPWEHMVFE